MIEADSSTSSELNENDEIFDEYQRGISDNFNQNVSSNAKNRKLYCFSCHRLEYHYSALKGTSYHYLLIGCTFGLALIFGPYRCRCCGHRRLCRYNFLNLRYHLHRRKYSIKSSSKSSRRRSSERRSTSRSSEQSESTSSERSDSNLSGPSKSCSTERSVESNGIRRTDPGHSESTSFVVADPKPDEIENPRRRRRRSRRSRDNKTLKSVPQIDSIGKERREREHREQLEIYAGVQQVPDFSIEGLMGSFETEESRKQKLLEIEEARAEKDPFVGKKAKPRKKTKGKPKRRFARKSRLTGPSIYCFTCHQDSEHYHVMKGTSYYFFVFGISFGLAGLVGPFRCSCCSKKRFWIANLLNPKYYIRGMLQRTGGYG